MQHNATQHDKTTIWVVMWILQNSAIDLIEIDHENKNWSKR